MIVSSKIRMYKTHYTKKEKAILQALDIQLNVIEGALNRFNKNLV